MVQIFAVLSCFYMHFGQFVRHSWCDLSFGIRRLRQKVLRLTTAHTHSLFPKCTQVDHCTHGQFIPETGSKKGSKNHNIAFSYRGRAFQTPLFRQSLSPRVRLTTTHTHSLFLRRGDESQRSIICCTYVRDCGVPPQTQYSVLRTEYSVVSTEYSVLSTQYTRPRATFPVGCTQY